MTTNDVKVAETTSTINASAPATKATGGFHYHGDAHTQIDLSKVKPRHNPLRLLGIAVVLLLLSMVAHMLVTQANFRWHVVGQYLFNPQVLAGVVVTIYLTVASMAIGIAIGIVVAVMRLSRSWVLVRSAQVFTWAFRSVPTLVQRLVGTTSPRFFLA